MITTSTTTLTISMQTFGCSAPHDYVSFTPDEVADVIESLSFKKASGPDEIDPEHLIYDGHVLVQHLTTIFNAILETGYNNYAPIAFARCSHPYP